MHLRRFYIARTIGFIMLMIILAIYFYFFKTEKEDAININNNIEVAQEDIAQEETNIEENIKEESTVIKPIAEFDSRITKKPFGIYISPQTSPVQPEKFSGYHTGVDVEYEDISEDILVVAIADGKVLRSGWVSGYGGMTAIFHKIEGKEYIVIYGHLDPNTLLNKDIEISQGDRVGVLGRGHSNETDGERKHLHLAVYTAGDINIRGYVSNRVELSKWIDPVELLK